MATLEENLTNLQHVRIIPTPRASKSREPLGSLEVIHHTVPRGRYRETDVLRCAPRVAHLSDPPAMSAHPGWIEGV